MPQTEEEHIENQNLDYEDLEKTNPDAEVCSEAEMSDANVWANVGLIQLGFVLFSVFI